MENRDQRIWVAVYTKYKAENWVAEQLKKKGIESYVPLLSKKKRYSKRIATYHYPIISCYCFAKIKPAQQLRILETQHVLGLIKYNNKLAAIPDHEIQILKKITGENLELECKLTENQVGQQVEIVFGNLTGLHGKLIDVKGKKEFVVQLENIGYQLQIKINPEHLQLLGVSKVA